jgi:hypothetical protein
MKALTDAEYELAKSHVSNCGSVSLASDIHSVQYRFLKFYRM